MLSSDLVQQGRHTMTVCNACRYCEGFCPVFPAMENRSAFSRSDLAYLANLCHNCGECLYACQYAPPHEFGINVPRTLAQIRVASYEEYCWPQGLSAAFAHQPLLAALALLAGFIAVFLTARTPLRETGLSGDFYQVIPHGVMVVLFAAASAFALVALIVGCRRFWRGVPRERGLEEDSRPLFLALRDALTLRHLHGGGVDCTDQPDARAPWRRWFHHATFYGFALCFVSTSVAALYHLVFGWRAPYSYTSLPVVLGTAGGVGLLIGPSGLLLLRRKRDEALGDSAQVGLDVSFSLMLMLTSVTGLLLLVLRERSVMPALLMIHLGIVLALFLTLPYAKFVHGVYRVAALVTFAMESARIHKVRVGG